MSDEQDLRRHAEVARLFAEVERREWFDSQGHSFYPLPRGRLGEDVARLAARRRNERWAAKQAPSTLKAIRVHAQDAWVRRKLAEDPEWRKKQYRRYRAKILVRAREKQKARYARLKQDPEWVQRKRAKQRERRLAWKMSKKQS